MGLLKDFRNWLNTPDEEEIVNGELNIKAFKGEDAKTIEELKKTARNVNKMGSSMFVDKTKTRAQTVSRMRAKVETPVMQNEHQPKVEDREHE